MATAPKNAVSAATPSTLPKSLTATLPSAVEIIGHLAAVATLLPKLDRELKDAKKKGAVQLAKAFVVFHRMQARSKELLQISDTGQVFGPLFKQYKEIEVPEALEQAGITHVPLDEGFRVGVSHAWRASIKSDQKEAAYDWLRSNGLEAIISETVNASTLSAAVKVQVEEHNREFPEELFNVAHVPNTSVTQTKK